MKIKSQRDFFAGLLFIVAGVAFAWGATTLNIGDAARMGPGYFPLVLGIVLTALGAFIVFGALVLETEDGDPIGKWAVKPLAFVTASNLVFGALIAGVPALGVPASGLVAATLALTIFASLAAERFSWKETLVLAAVLGVACWFVFVVELHLALPLWPAFAH